MRWSLVIGQFTWENSDGLHISRGSFATWAFKHFNISFFVLVCHCYCLLISSPAQLNLRPVKKRSSIFSKARFLLTSHKCCQCYHLCICIFICILTVKVLLDNIKNPAYQPLPLHVSLRRVLTWMRFFGKHTARKARLTSSCKWVGETD